MARGRRCEQWDHTADLLAKIHNVNVIDAAALLRPLDFHPLYTAEERAEIEEAVRQAEKADRQPGSVGTLATLIVGRPPPEK